MQRSRSRIQNVEPTSEPRELSQLVTLDLSKSILWHDVWTTQQLVACLDLALRWPPSRRSRVMQQCQLSHDTSVTS